MQIDKKLSKCAKQLNKVYYEIRHKKGQYWKDRRSLQKSKRGVRKVH